MRRKYAPFRQIFVMLQRLIPRVGVPLTQIARVSVETKFTPIKRMQRCPKGFLRNSNPLVEGKVLIKKWRSATGRNLDIVLAVPKDRDMLATHFGEGFSALNSCCVHHKMTYEEFECMAAPETDLCLDEGLIFCAYDRDKLVGTLFTSYNYKEKFETMFHGEMPGMKNPVFRIKEDYADDVKKYPFSLSMNYFMTLLDVVQPQTGKFLPADIKGFGINESATIHPDYQKDGICNLFFELSDKSFKERGIHHVGAYCIASGSRKIGQRLGYDSLFALNYADFKENGKPIYYDLYDGAYCSDTLVRTLK